MPENVIYRHFPRRVLKIVIPGLVLLLFYGLAARSGAVVVERMEVPLPGRSAVGALYHCFPNVSTFRITRLWIMAPCLPTSSTKIYKKYSLRFFLICYVLVEEVEAGKILENKGSPARLSRRLKYAPAGMQARRYERREQGGIRPVDRLADGGQGKIQPCPRLLVYN